MIKFVPHAASYEAKVFGVKAGTKLDKDEVGSTPLTDTIGRKQLMEIISESGL